MKLKIRVGRRSRQAGGQRGVFAKREGGGHPMFNRGRSRLNHVRFALNFPWEFAALWLRWCVVSGAIGSAPRYTCPDRL